jgi:hypothetical protein
MSALPKKNIKFSLDQSEKVPVEKVENSRPNIDHLMSKINEERRQEKRRNLQIIAFILISLASASFFFTQV